MTARRRPPEQALPELLAPAGDLACLKAATQGGCDAVYFGVGEHNMRSGAARNFTVDDLDDISRRLRDCGVRGYLTVNTLVFERERADVASLLEHASERVDAVIGWDPFVIQECRRLGIPIHLSTQASVANPEAARFYRDLGVQRIVPARECTLEELRVLRDRGGVALEVFVHGAMCMAVSGRCFLSQDVYGHSANRGRCLQNCRRRYRIVDVEEGAEHMLGESTVMSAKDLCALPLLDTLLEAGFDAFKIEGRGRNPEYVRTVAECYREAMDAWAEGDLCDERKRALTTRLATVFNRGFSEGFYMGRPIAEFTDRPDNQATLSKEFVGRVTHYYPKAGVVRVDVQADCFSRGDELLIQGPTTGVVAVTVDEVRQNEVPVSEVRRGEATVPVPEKVRFNDRIYVRRERATPEKAENRA